MFFFYFFRDENHKPLPGIELGDLGNKIGDNTSDSGYMVLQNVRITRENLLSKFHYVDSEGNYISNKIDPKILYSTMMYTRAFILGSSSVKLMKACTIAVRYNAVRKQGFKDTSTRSHLFFYFIKYFL